MLVVEDARKRVSEISEMTDNYVVPAFDWERDYGSLYRDCPSAFWLAPDGSRQIVPVEEPRRAHVLHLAPKPPEELALPSVSGRIGGGGLSLAVAGPVFLTTAMLFDGLERGVGSGIVAAFASLAAFPFTIPVGAVLGLLPVVLGVSVLSHLGIKVPEARPAWVWTLVGAAMGFCIAAMFDAGIPIGAALVATSATCARIARSWVQWHDPEAI